MCFLSRRFTIHRTAGELNIKFNKLITKVNNLENKIPDESTLVNTNQYNTGKQNFEKKVGDFDKKIPDVSGLVTTTVLHTKISKFENKIPGTSGLVTTTALHTKMEKLRTKYQILVV